MSEFKFACPVCGQHITADASTSGGQIECPTCFQKIVVPQAPASQDSKFILSAAQVAKPRPTSPDAASQSGPLPASSQRTPFPALVALLVLLGAAGAALFVFRDRVFKPARTMVSRGTNAPAQASNAPGALNPAYPVPTNITWTLDLTNAVFPETAVVGRIHGSGFACERTTIQGGTLSLRQGTTWPPDLGITVLLNWRPGEKLSGRTIEITPAHPRPPRVVLRWKDEQQQPITENINSGYALKLTFGEAANGRMPGRIYLCLPDADKSFVAGTFDAEIRKPSPPKRPPPRPPKPRT